MSLINTIIKTSVTDIMMRADDATDHRVMTREEALRFLQEMAREIEVRIDWVREAIKQSEQDNGKRT
jgi:pyruvate/2-oxoglutarate dehydrogenase complex dihydrolipoamide acyltransferase (E2) component